jgi:hypothetical protein
MEYFVSLERHAVDVVQRTIRGIAVNWAGKVPD